MFSIYWPDLTDQSAFNYVSFYKNKKIPFTFSIFDPK
jgi:hypothetical protein